ncbi:MAG TPA: alpha/beta fold hydrolase [Nocardioidaceae bacterium]|nr:alpha/beta fold hydrolase [Nocardioidaceae bacterium]
MRGRLVTAALLVLLAAACTDAVEPASAPTPSRTASETASPAAETPGETSKSPAESSSPEPSRTADPVHPVSLPALFDKRYDGRRLRLGNVLVRTDAYTQRAVTYRGDGLTLSGIMNIPEGKGPFPVLVLAHGYIDPDVYVTGQGLRREQDWLARAGYVVLHVDYRNHAGSDGDPRADKRLRLDYTVDVINAVKAVRRSGLRFVDPERVGLLGRSMGGGVVYNVLAVAPGLVDAAVVFAPVSSRAGDNFNRWVRDDAGRSQLSRSILRDYGAPENRPEFWREASARTYFDRVSEPLLIHHGTADESCPIRWSRASYAALQRAGADARLFVYPGEPHAFIDAWPLSMRRTVRFFERNID